MTNNEEEFLDFDDENQEEKKNGEQFYKHDNVKGYVSMKKEQILLFKYGDNFCF